MSHSFDQRGATVKARWMAARRAAAITFTIAVSAALFAADVPPAIPPSPSTAPGVRIWPPPAFTHWPAIAYSDESRNIAFSLPVQTAGVAGSIGWRDESALPFTLPEGTERISGVLPLPLTFGGREATVLIGAERTGLSVRVVSTREAWPLTQLVNGFPTDEHSVPVVLVDVRRNADVERRWWLIADALPRPNGRALVLGDPLTALDDHLFTGLDADCRVALDERFPQHAVLVEFALQIAKQPAALPRTLVWCPGNQVLHGGAISDGTASNNEEERVLGAIRARFSALGVQPRLLLALPPLPVEAELRTIAVTRRAGLARSAEQQHWQVLDLARIAGDPEQANRVDAGLFTRYPVGAAAARCREALARELIN